MKSGLLHAENLAYNYHDGTRALDGVSISLGQNIKAAILGPNGAGKSTLFLHFNGLLRPHSGTVYYKGQALQYHKKALEVLRREVGIVFQNPDNQLFSASVFQDISFGLMNQGCKPAEARRRVEEVGYKLGIDYLFSKPTHFLSVGQKKMVALAGVLVMEPELIICDEPTAGLDPGNAECFMQVLDGLHQQGKTLLISTHDVNLAYQWADEVWLLNQGKVLAQGSPVEVFSQAELLKAARLKTPWLLEIWREMADRGLTLADLPPRTKTQLRQSIINLKPETAEK
jgi:cobalt/nickel transport system ATP-binding protein